MMGDTASIQAPSITPSAENTAAQQSIDSLFDKHFDKVMWEPIRPPQALGELLDSRYMLPLLFPSDPRLLSALPGKPEDFEDNKRMSIQSFSSSSDRSDKASSRNSNAGAPFSWKSRNRKVREVGVGTLQWVDGIRSASRWGRPVAPDYEPEEDNENHARKMNMSDSDDQDDADADVTMKINTHVHVTPLTRKPSGRAKGRPSMMGEVTPIETSFDQSLPPAVRQ